jgi:hypothetical protein
MTFLFLIYLSQVFEGFSFYFNSEQSFQPNVCISSFSSATSSSLAIAFFSFCVGSSAGISLSLFLYRGALFPAVLPESLQNLSAQT